MSVSTWMFCLAYLFDMCDISANFCQHIYIYKYIYICDKVGPNPCRICICTCICIYVDRNLLMCDIWEALVELKKRMCMYALSPR